MRKRQTVTDDEKMKRNAEKERDEKKEGSAISSAPEEGTDVAAQDGVSVEPIKAAKSNNIAPDVSMIKNALKNFFKNLIYVFVPMGTVYLFMLFAILLFATSTAKNLSETVAQVLNTVGNSIEQSSASLEEFLSFAFGKINWNGSFLDTLSKLLDINWISETVKGFFGTLSASTEGFDAEIDAILAAFGSRFATDVGLSLSLVALGVWIANIVTRYILRRRTAKRTLKNAIVAHTLVPLAQSAVVFVAGILFVFIKWFAILVMVAAVALWAVISLMNSYIIYRDKSIDLTLKQVITPRNVISHILVGVIVLAIDVALCVALWFVHAVLCILVAIPFLIYSIDIIDLNTDSYVQGVVESIKRKAEPQAVAQVEEQ